MKIMTFNTQHCLNYLERKIDFELMAKVILDWDADIVGLNEMRGSGQHPEYTAQTERLAELTGMKYRYFAKALDIKDKGPYGNAILSKIPIVTAETIPIPDPEVKIPNARYRYESRCILKAELENGLTVLVAHFGLNPDEQKNAVKAVVEELSGERCVLMGDFNADPDNSVFAPVRARMKDTADCFAMPKLSWPSDEPARKLDYIFVSPDVKVINADIPPIVASDHRPHTATLEL